VFVRQPKNHFTEFTSINAKNYFKRKNIRPLKTNVLLKSLNAFAQARVSRQI